MVFTVNVTAMSLVDLREKLNNLLEKARQRHDFGWKPFQMDEEWEYNSYGRWNGHSICPQCEEFEANRVFREGDMARWLPNAVSIGMFLAKPNTHVTYPEPHPRGVPKMRPGDWPCYCEMVMLHPAETLALRLSVEFWEALL